MATINPNLEIFDKAVALIESTPCQSKVLSSGEVLSYRVYNPGMAYTIVMIPGYCCDDILFSVRSDMHRSWLCLCLLTLRLIFHNYTSLQTIAYRRTSRVWGSYHYCRQSTWLEWIEYEHKYLISWGIRWWYYRVVETHEYWEGHGWWILYRWVYSVRVLILPVIILQPIHLRYKLSILLSLSSVTTGGGIAFHMAHKNPDMITHCFMIHSIALNGFHVINEDGKITSPDNVAEMFSAVWPDEMTAESLHENFRMISSNVPGLPPVSHPIMSYITPAVAMKAKKECMVANV